MRNFLFLIFLMPMIAQSQIFDSGLSIGTAMDLTGATGSCAANGSKFVQVNVSGLPILSNSFSINKINISFLEDCTGNINTTVNLNLIDIFLKAPNGVCTRIYDGGLSTSNNMENDPSNTPVGPALSLKPLDITLTTNTVPCLNNPQTSNSGSSSSSSTNQSNYGIYYAVSTAPTSLNLESTFNTVDPNGTWTVIFSESTTSEPCIGKVSLSFGNPATTDLTASGDNCSNPIIWNGGAFCASTNGKTGSVQMPGSATGAGGTTFIPIGGQNCGWNAANNNDIWIQFVASSTNVCININGIDQNQQSIVVRDSNADGDNNPCTGAALNAGSTNDPRWTVVSCPRDAIYTTTSGSQLNHNHCFTATIGQTYFLIVDGNGGVESSFFISDGSGILPNVLPVTFDHFKGHADMSGNWLKWTTASEKNAAFFELEYSSNGIDFEYITDIQAHGNSENLQHYYYFHPNPLKHSYYRLKQIDFNGQVSYCQSIVEINREQKIILNYNPSTESISWNNPIPLTGFITDIQGKTLLNFSQNTELKLNNFANGVYILNYYFENQLYTFKFFK